VIRSSQNPNTTIFFQSLGCAKNLVDAEVMLGIVDKAQYKIVDQPQDASVIVVNTCSFINDAKQESINTVLELAQHKEKGTCERLIMTGCLPQRYKADLKVALPEVDAFVGTGQYADILKYVDGKSDDSANFNHPKYLHSENTPRINSQPFYRAYLKISEGCIKNCSFCIIPKIRGTLRSRTIPSLIEEATRLVEGGVLELNLIGQDLTDYGKELRDGSNLPNLLKALTKIEGLKWIRMLYVYPDEMDSELLEVIATEDKICKYVDMPVQHVSDRMLQLMNRKRTTGKLIKDRIAKLREMIPEVNLRSTVIVGYPSETEAEFKELKQFVTEMEFDHLGVFAYSLEENTASYFHPDHLDEQIKENRRNELLTLQQNISAKRLKQHVGKSLNVLVEKMNEDLLWQGRHAGQAPEVDGVVLLHDGDFVPGQMLDVKIQSTMEYDLIGSPI